MSQISFRQELARKSLHITSVVVPVGYAVGLSRKLLLIALSFAAVVALTVELARAYHTAARHHFHRLVGVLLREHEHLRWSGATWLVLAFLALVLIAPREVAVAGMWALSIGDAAAAIVG